jgi:prepilin signal peptidase PulO-like enzyme (type II secretory pathway)
MIGAVVGLGLLAAKLTQRKSRLPYGAFLAVGTYVAIYAGPWIPQRLNVT